MKPVCPTVLVIAEFGTLNGGENSFLTVASSLRDRGWEFAVTAETQSPLGQACAERGLKTVPFSFFLPADGSPGNASARKPLETLRIELAELISRTRPSLIHCNSLSTSRIVGPVARELEVPSLGYLRDIMNVNKTVIRDINSLDAIIAVSEATRQFHVAQGLSTDKSHTIHNGIELEHFHPSTTVNFQPPFRLLYVGQVGMRKGLDTLLDSILLLPSSLELELELVGERHSQKPEAVEYESQLHRMATEINATSTRHVRFLGRQPDIAKRMQTADLLVHPANQEPLGRVLLEAFASGLPVVATIVGGTPEIFAGLEKWSLLVKPKSAAELASTIEKVLDLPQAKYEALAGEVRQIAERRFDVKLTASRLDAVYRKLVFNQVRARLSRE